MVVSKVSWRCDVGDFLDNIDICLSTRPLFSTLSSPTRATAPGVRSAGVRLPFVVWTTLPFCRLYTPSSA